MVLDYDRRPNATTDEKLISLMENVQLALNEKDEEIKRLKVLTEKLTKAAEWISSPNLESNSGDVYYTAKRTDTGTSVSMGVGSGGTNHGVWSGTMQKWLLYGDGTNVYLNNIPVDFKTYTSTSGVFTPASGITVNAFRYLKWGKIAYLYINWSTSSSISVAADGNATNVTIGTLASGFRPWTQSVGTSYGDNGGPAFYSIENSGSVMLGAVGGTGSSRTIAADTAFQCGAVFFLE